MGITSTLFHDKIPLLLIKTAHKWQSSELQFSRKPFFFQDLIASKNLLVDFCNARAFWQKPCHELLKVYYLESSEAIFWFIPILICSFSFIFLIIFFLDFEKQENYFPFFLSKIYYYCLILHTNLKWSI